MLNLTTCRRDIVEEAEGPEQAAVGIRRDVLAVLGGGIKVKVPQVFAAQLHVGAVQAVVELAAVVPIGVHVPD